MGLYRIESTDDRILAEVIGSNLCEAIGETLTLNGHEELTETDWNVFDEDNKLVVCCGTIVQPSNH